MRTIPFVVVAFLWIQATVKAQEEAQVTPVSILDINKDLRPLYFGADTDKFISTYAASVDTARQVCQNLTDLTGKRFHLLVVETSEEAAELEPYIKDLEIDGFWTAGKRDFDSHGEVSTYWLSEKGAESLMGYKSFHSGLSIRRRRDVDSHTELIHETSNSLTAVMRPWLKMSSMQDGRCRSSRLQPSGCEPIQCNVTMPECQTETPPCTINEQSKCSVIRPPCSAKCENCTVEPRVCTAIPKPCTVRQQPCQITQEPCKVTRPPCTTTRPPCRTVQPPCEVTTPPPCEPKPRCRLGRKCRSVRDPCKKNSKNETVCPEPKTVCDPSCPPPEICQSPAIICPPPLVYCEPENTTCPEPIIQCEKPVLYCPPPEVDCPKPEVVCEPPKVNCSSPIVNCGSIVSQCSAPVVDCPAPAVTCPPAEVVCNNPPPCPTPEIPPPGCEETTTTEAPTTTRPPCGGCGCVVASKKHKFQWDVENCRDKYHFICEG